MKNILNKSFVIGLLIGVLGTYCAVRFIPGQHAGISFNTSGAFYDVYDEGDQGQSDKDKCREENKAWMEKLKKLVSEGKVVEARNLWGAGAPCTSIADPTVVPSNLEFCMFYLEAAQAAFDQKNVELSIFFNQTAEILDLFMRDSKEGFCIDH